MKNLDADREMLAEMKALFEQECQKTPKQRNYELINQLTAAMYEATSSGDLSETQAQALESLTLYNTKQTRQRSYRWLRPVISVCMVIVLGLCLNTWTIRVWGLNLYEAVYQIVQGGISLSPADLESENTIELETSPDDPYGIRKICEDIGFTPRTPSYIPEQMALKKMHRTDENIKKIILTYQHGNQYLAIDYAYIEDDELFQDTKFGFPSDKYNIHTETIGGTQVLISWEDQIFHAIFSEEHIVCHIACKKMDYDTAYQVLTSFF